MVKIDLITGFLGSGKTTFIREYARYLVGKREKIAIIENDYGAVNIDMVLLQDLLGDNCNLEMIVGGDGKEAHRRRFRTKLISMGMSGYDRVIIEPSGIYDVDEFFDVLYDEPLDRWYEIGSVIAIVDAKSVHELLPDKNDKHANSSDENDISRYVFMSEISGAGKLIISKITEKTDTKEVSDEINQIMAEYGLGDGASCSEKESRSEGGGNKPWFDSNKDIIAKPFSELTIEDFESIESCGYRHASYVKIPLEDSSFTPLFYFDVEMDEVLLSKTIGELFKDARAGHIIRIKGFVKTGEEKQSEVNATEKEMQLRPAVSSRNVLIIIGENLDKQYINELFKDYCAVVSL
ncbi:GTP-binding protein [Butyrivibrio sp. VCD2006]|uniref:GTP-binding protein n=1 Tax=Butyrivibrio sp. VCD2006 TaxID=1280664 RepID=UPI0003FFDFD7|nr:GTP-binding protein [Butyrivibrio sp. VCD2006]